MAERGCLKVLSAKSGMRYRRADRACIPRQLAVGLCGCCGHGRIQADQVLYRRRSVIQKNLALEQRAEFGVSRGTMGVMDQKQVTGGGTTFLPLMDPAPRNATGLLRKDPGGTTEFPQDALKSNNFGTDGVTIPNGRSELVNRNACQGSTCSIPGEFRCCSILSSLCLISAISTAWVSSWRVKRWCS